MKFISHRSLISFDDAASQRVRVPNIERSHTADKLDVLRRLDFFVSRRPLTIVLSTNSSTSRYSIA